MPVATPLDAMNLVPLMRETSGRAEVVIGLLDGPVAAEHPDLAGAPIRPVARRLAAVCAQPAGAACAHGTYIAGILSARRGSAAPAICPGCTLLVRPIFRDACAAGLEPPQAAPADLASAVVEAVDAGARLLNVSASLGQWLAAEERQLRDALNYAAARGVITIAAAGNEGALGTSTITGHAWVIPVVACDRQGRPSRRSNLAGGIGRRGLRAVGEGVTSLSAGGGTRTLSGTSAAAAFVTGTLALLWSEFPKASATELKMAVTRRHPGFAPRGGECVRKPMGPLELAGGRPSVTPPLLNAWMAYALVARREAGADGRADAETQHDRMPDCS